MNILSFVETNEDLFNLTHVSSVLRTLALQLFKTLELPLRNAHGVASQLLFSDYRILKIFQDTQRSTIVTNFRIQLFCFARRTPHITGVGGVFCNKLDRALGDALFSMAKLEVLNIDCRLCSGHQRHFYLPKFHPERLRDLAFKCYCTPNRHIKCIPVSKFRMFDNVQTLSWATSRFHLELSKSTDVSRLIALESDGSSMDAILLAKRPIRRLLIGDPLLREDLVLHSALDSCPGLLTHIIFESFCDATVIDTWPTLFANVRHVGTISISGHLCILVSDSSI